MIGVWDEDFRRSMPKVHITAQTKIVSYVNPTKHMVWVKGNEINHWKGFPGYHISCDLPVLPASSCQARKTVWWDSVKDLIPLRLVSN